MKVINFNGSAEPSFCDARRAGSQGDILVAIKRTSNARDLRGTLMALVCGLDESSGAAGCAAQAVCVLLDSRVSDERLLSELRTFQRVVRTDLSSLLARRDKADPTRTVLPESAQALERQGFDVDAFVRESLLGAHPVLLLLDR